MPLDDKKKIGRGPLAKTWLATLLLRPSSCQLPQESNFWATAHCAAAGLR